jgi:purine-binding chemotaxis protein CheW
MRVLLFSIGEEQFASPLATICESLDEPLVRPMPGAGDHAVGVIDLRGRRVPAYSPSVALNVSLDEKAGAALIIGEDSASIALLISDVDDVLEVDPSEIRIAPGSEDPDGILLGVFQHGGRLVSVVDPEAIRDACHAAGAKR